MQFPRLLVVRQKFPDRKIPDVAAEVRSQLAASGFAGRLKPGSRVAIGVGSRGIHNIATIVRNVVQYWKEQGMRPFLFPAMGSHGAASAAGQAEVLAHYGITEATMGCPLISQLEVVSLGKTADGIEAFMDKMAYDADGVMLVGRVKWHTDFAGKIESGLFKMMAIGLGKFAGAQRYHSYAYRLGLEHVIRSVGRQVLKSGKILGGLAILEDAYHNTAKLDAVPVEAMEQREEENLALVKSWMAKIPMDLDILILDEIGKNISGAGMDTKVANRGVNGEYNPWPNTPKFQRLFLRNLSEHTYNSSVGMGMADVVTDRLVNRINWEPTWINSLTANTPAAIRTPIHFPTDRECIERIAPTVGRLDLSEVTFGWIRNTMELTRIAVSENVKAEIEKNSELEIEATIDFDFDGEGNLISPFIPLEETAGAH
uniref:LarA-like N-terminal domain-containing protein n=1 Tax=Solibacter usitatus (strain Ellin6076) TaxID=234267 RepID=Q01W64_SOLUE